MNGNKVLEVIKIYRNFFEFSDTLKGHFPHNRIVNRQDGMLIHCHGMLDQMEEFVKQGKMEKVFRWLGFVQGCLWSSGAYTLDELKNHNRPSKAKEGGAIEFYTSSMIGMEPPKSEDDNGRHRITIGDSRESYHIGWVDEHGFYTDSSEGKLVKVSISQLICIVDNIDLIRLVRMEKEMDQNPTD